jgi:hypothetical protein
LKGSQAPGWLITASGRQLRREVLVMGYFRRGQQGEECNTRFVMGDDRYKKDKGISGFLTALEGSSREILLFWTALVLLLFNLLERQPASKGDP